MSGQSADASGAATASTVDVDDALLLSWPLPMPADDGDKEERGRTLVIAGSAEMPGAALLAATAALRAGAGKLSVATAASIAAGLALAMPEARVVGLAESPAGGFDHEAARQVDELLGKCDALVVGPGMQDEAATCAFVRQLLPRCTGLAVVLDALAMSVLADAAPADQPLLLTPHAGEMAHLTGLPKEEIVADPERAARDAARRWNAVVALKGACTIIAAPDGRTWRHRGGNSGLATSGSGDTLAGIVAGLAARGASLEQAAVWGVALHARAGTELAARQGPLGYLARELLGEIPQLMHRLGQPPAQPVEPR